MDGMNTVIRGTHVKASHSVGYFQVGETPETIAKEIAPRITLSQVYKAMRYYFVHKAEIDKEREENTEAASRNLIRKRLGTKKHKEITGGWALPGRIWMNIFGLILQKSCVNRVLM